MYVHSEMKRFPELKNPLRPAARASRLNPLDDTLVSSCNFPLDFVQAEHEICKPQLRLGDRERDEAAWCLQEFEENVAAAGSDICLPESLCKFRLGEHVRSAVSSVANSLAVIFKGAAVTGFGVNLKIFFLAVVVVADPCFNCAEYKLSVWDSYFDGCNEYSSIAKGGRWNYDEGMDSGQCQGQENQIECCNQRRVQPDQWDARDFKHGCEWNADLGRCLSKPESVGGEAKIRAPCYSYHSQDKLATDNCVNEIVKTICDANKCDLLHPDDGLNRRLCQTECRCRMEPALGDNPTEDEGQAMRVKTAKIRSGFFDDKAAKRLCKANCASSTETKSLCGIYSDAQNGKSRSSDGSFDNTSGSMSYLSIGAGCILVFVVGTCVGALLHKAMLRKGGVEMPMNAPQNAPQRREPIPAIRQHRGLRRRQ